jgi:ABC-type branched-subunit amino acid transport system substrate-binding protein
MLNAVAKKNDIRFIPAEIGTLIVGLAILLTSCGGVDPVVKIGLVGPFEGRYRDIGYDVIYSARLAVREINELGGIDGYRLALVALDDFGDPEIAQETAEALILDPGVVAVVGHWLPETTNTAAKIYTEAGLAFVAAGSEPFDPFNPEGLPVDFQKAYEAVTPFDELPGPMAAPAYDAFGLVIEAMRVAISTEGTISRESMVDSLRGLSYEGLTGQVKAANIIE